MIDISVINVNYRGSADDFAKVQPTLQRLVGQPATPHVFKKPQNDGNGGPEGAPVTAELVFYVLSRRHLSKSARRVFKALLSAGPEGLSAPELAQAVGLSRNELAGVFGAFGRRLSHTKGWPEDEAFLDVDQNDEGEVRYKLPPVLRGVLESGRIKL